jgi:hypothetical protein
VGGMPALTLDANWAPASNGIYFMNGNPANCSFIYFEFSTAKVRRVMELPDRAVHRMDTLFSIPESNVRRRTSSSLTGSADSIARIPAVEDNR